jgi:Skp family chaperone for outer membrane proteins
MKKLMVVLAAVAGLMLAGSDKAAAQTKMGYFDLEYVVSLMPGVSKVDTLLAQFEKDSLGMEYDFRLSEFQRNDSTLRADSAKMPARLYQEKKNDLIQKFYVLQNWQQYSQQVGQAKQQELMEPFFTKALKAFQEVVEEGKYGYVFKRETLWLAPPADNLIPLVAKKMGLKLPVDPNAPKEEAPKPTAKPAPAKPKQ